LQVSSLNRELQVLRRMFHLAQEWGKVERALPNVKMLPGEKHRERVLTAREEDLYFEGASTDAMAQYADVALLRDVGGGPSMPRCSIRKRRRNARACWRR
jgi:hypothetical protein